MAIFCVAGWLISIRGGFSLRDYFSQPLGPDFLPFYAAGKLMSEGRGEEIYQLNSMIEMQSRILKSSQEYLHYFPYPPPFAWVMQFFASWDYRIAFGLWSFLGLGIYYAIARFWGFTSHPLLGLGWFPVFAVLSYGQNTFFSMGILSLVAWLWCYRKESFQAGLVAGLLCYKPQLAFGVGVGVILLREWRMLMGMIVMGLGGLSFSLIFLRSETISYFEFLIHKMPLLIQIPGSSLIQCGDWKSFWSLIFPGIESQWSLGLYLGMTLFWVVLFKQSIRYLAKEDRFLRMGGVFLLLVLIAPYLLIYDFSILLLALGLFSKSIPLNESWKSTAIGVMWLVGWIHYPLALYMRDAWGFVIPLIPVATAFLAIQIVPHRLNSSQNGQHL